ncbi:MAG: HAMP domain-containing histidine kinase [Chloroflexi bacterium]|nr:sensor histidine kinase [Chloroflexota bacterium]NOG66505.1 HAMP domain-containing histidine kinase [Chloroflexota bacterium]
MSKYVPDAPSSTDSQEIAEAVVRMAATYRTPFIAIIGFSEALLDGLSGALNDAQRGDIEAVRTAGWQALGQLNDILDVMNLISGEMVYEKDALNPNQLLKDVIRDFSRARPDQTSLLQSEVEENLPTVEGDELKLRQILLSLLQAGVQESPEQALIIRAKKSDDGVLVEIRDAYQVSNNDDLTYFFSPGWVSKLANNRWRRMQWQTYLAHHLIHGLGGKIWVEAVTADEKRPAGTQVSFVLPFKKEEAKPSA